MRKVKVITLAMLIAYLPCFAQDLPSEEFPADYFQFECERYLVAKDPKALETTPTVDLETAVKVTRARIFLYDHPLDRVILRLIRHELASRQILQSDE